MTTHPFILKPHHDNILKSFPTYFYLTVEQVSRLHYSKGSAKYVSEALKTLFEQKYLDRFYKHRSSRYGSGPTVYLLGSRGVHYLRTQGVDLPKFHPSEHTAYKQLFLDHTLAINDILIAASKLPTESPAIHVAAIQHDLSLKHTMKGVVPDGWIDFRINEKEQVCLWLEMDMGTMDQKPFRRKIASLVAYSREDYQRVFGTPSLTIAIVTLSGEQRRTNILTWIQRELTALQREDVADLFRVLSVSRADMTPEHLFLAAICSRPFDKTLLPLIER